MSPPPRGAVGHCLVGRAPWRGNTALPPVHTAPSTPGTGASALHSKTRILLSSTEDSCLLVPRFCWRQGREQLTKERSPLSKRRPSHVPKHWWRWPAQLGTLFKAGRLPSRVQFNHQNSLLRLTTGLRDMWAGAGLPGARPSAPDSGLPRKDTSGAQQPYLSSPSGSASRSHPDSLAVMYHFRLNLRTTPPLENWALGCRSPQHPVGKGLWPQACCGLPCSWRPDWGGGDEGVKVGVRAQPPGTRAAPQGPHRRWPRGPWPRPASGQGPWCQGRWSLSRRGGRG